MEPSPRVAGRTRVRLAIVLFNLGGPDRLEAVAPFLVNLFTDPAILRVPRLIRPLLARLIAKRRVKAATENYRILGGGSPLLSLTEEQAAALTAALPEFETRCFIAMRYWHPFAAEAMAEVQAFAPDEVVLLPLYPQFSTTTTGSSVTDWAACARAAGAQFRTRLICCYPEDEAFVAATARIIGEGLARARAEMARHRAGTEVRVLFSAHGLPQVIVDQGDPYQFQVERTAALLAARLGLAADGWRVCYQSRATPQKWLDPSIETELRNAAKDKVAVLVVPVAFVSEHSETLVELDVEYRELAEEIGLAGYFRVPTQNADRLFIEALAGLVRRSLAAPESTRACPCPGRFGDCPWRRGCTFEVV